MEVKIFLILISFGFASAQFEINGTCPNFTECRDININVTKEGLVGIWYLASSIPYFFQLNKKCSYINITVSTGPSQYFFEKFEFDVLTDEKRVTTGYFNITTDGITDVTYTDLVLPFHFETLKFTADYWVLVSCYDCDFFGHPKGIYGYVWSRIAFPDCQVEIDSINILEKCGISNSSLITENQSNCTLCV